MTRRRQLLSRAVVALFAAFAPVAFGCEAIVGDSVSGTITCTPGTPPAEACPSGQECVAGTCLPCANPACVTLPVDAGHDTSVLPLDAGHDTSLPPDTGHDAGHDAGMDASMPEAATLGAIGDPCADDTACTSGLCVSSADVNGVTVKSTSVCSQACCTDTDCGAGNVCYPTEAGGYCVTSTAAATCGGSCGTPCCMTSDCADGDDCAISTTSFGSSVASCQTPGGGGDGDFCEQDTDCDDGVCDDTNSCENANDCCSDADCHGSDACSWVTAPDADGSSNPVFRTCFSDPENPNGSTPTGQACSDETDCVDGLCLLLPGQSTKMCTQACCTNTNCNAAVERWICEPSSIQLKSGGMVTVFVCGPPA